MAAPCQFASAGGTKAFPKATMPRCCSSCNRNLSKDCYSKNQWSKGEGYSRCHACVNPGSARVDSTQTARENNATRASFGKDALDYPFASGNFRWVAKGVYDEGDRAGQPCVCKWFKTGGVLESHFYDADLATAQEALRLITKWNSKGLIDKIVKVNQPEVWTFVNNCRRDFANRKVLQEPFIKNYQKFNSNTGWADDSLPWPRVMQALSHFSYHISNGQSVLCDLQGGVYQDGVVLTDPVIMSVSRIYGPTDLGLDGINSFFAYHKCNEFCRSEWRRPRNPVPVYSRVRGTSMEHAPNHVPTRRSRPPMSMGAIYE